MMGVAVQNSVIIFLGTELSTKFTLSGVRAVDKIKRQRRGGTGNRRDKQ